MFSVVIVSPLGHEFDPDDAPTFDTLEEARDQALQLSLTLDALGDSSSAVVVRNLRNGVLESAYAADLGYARALSGW